MSVLFGGGGIKTMSVLQETRVHLLLSLQCQLQGSPPSQKLQSSMCRMSKARGRLCAISAIVPTAWPQGGRLSQQFLRRGQVPTRTPPQSLFKQLLLLWDQWPGEKLDWTLEWTTLPRNGWRRCFSCLVHLKMPLSQGKMEDTHTD